MALEQADREFIELIVAQKVREGSSSQRSSLVEDVVTQLSTDARLALFESQIREKVEGSVEASLKKRYTAIAIVTAAIVGGGAGLATTTFLTTLNNEATELLRKNKAELSAYQEFMTRSREDLRGITKQFVPLKEEVEAAVAIIQTQHAVTERQQRTAEETLKLLAQTTKTLSDLKSQADKQIKQSDPQSIQAGEEIKKLQEGVRTAQASVETSRYRVFLHFGNSDLGLVLENKIKSQLRESGFIVVGADRKDDEAGGSGIDFFYDEDCVGAEKLTNLLSTILPPGATTVPVRKQSSFNQPGTLGVWLSKVAPRSAKVTDCKK